MTLIGDGTVHTYTHTEEKNRVHHSVLEYMKDI